MKEIAKALSQAQGKFPSIPKNKTAKLPGGREYKYADIHDVLKAVIPVLSECKLSLIQSLEEVEGKSWLVSTLLHESGQKIENRIPVMVTGPMLKGGGYGQVSMQSVGTALTYSRRYGASALLGVQSDEDTDGTEGRSTEPRVPDEYKNTLIMDAMVRLKKFPDFEKEIKAKMSLDNLTPQQYIRMMTKLIKLEIDS